MRSIVIVILLFISCAIAAFPSAAGTQSVSSTIKVTGIYDGGMKRFYGSGSLGSSGQSEDQDALFEISSGGTLKNVIIGAPAADGVHCEGSCTIQNVWWEDVGEDAATFRGSGSPTFLVDGGGARKADDKVFQHNGAGTVTIRNFEVSDFGKLYRSCGNCGTQYKRTVVIDNVVVTAPGKSIVGINTNYGDTATLKKITIVGDSSKKMAICDRFTGNNKGDEPPKTGSGNDGTYCKYSTSDITYSSTAPATIGSTSSTPSTPAPSTSGSSTTRKFYNIKNVNSGKCIDVAGSSTSDGGDIIQKTCSSSTSQIWELKPAEGNYYYLVNYKSGKYADVESCGTGDGANIRQWSGLSNTCQQFLFDNASNGIYRFINRNSGKVMEVAGCSTSDNGDIKQWTNLNNDCQKWSMIRVLN